MYYLFKRKNQPPSAKAELYVVHSQSQTDSAIKFWFNCSHPQPQPASVTPAQKPHKNSAARLKTGLPSPDNYRETHYWFISATNYRTRRCFIRLSIYYLCTNFCVYLSVFMDKEFYVYIICVWISVLFLCVSVY